MTNLAEDLLLISLDDDGRPRNPGSALGYAVAAVMVAVTASSVAASSSGN